MNRFESARNRETAGRKIDLRFEEGRHVNKNGIASLVKEIESGDPDAHDWNAAVTRRMRTYAPSFIALDGLFHMTDDIQADQDSLSDFKKAVWATIPGRPSEINGSDHVFVVGGDNVIGSLGYSPWNNPHLGLAELVIFAKTGQVMGRNLGEYTRTAAQWYSSHDPINGESEPLSQTDRTIISRRRLIGGTLGFVAGAAIRPLSIFGTSDAPWPSLQRMSRAVNDEMEPALWLSRHNDESAIDGRTALLTEKADSVKKLLTPSSEDRQIGAIVMGNLHTYNADKLIQSPRKRRHYIRRYAEDLDKAIQSQNPTVINFLGGESIAEQRARMADFFALTDIWSVNEPDEARFKQDPQAEINRIVNRVAIHNSQEIRDLLAV